MKVLAPLPDSGRFDYSPITTRPDYRWPNGASLAVYIGFTLEHSPSPKAWAPASARSRRSPMC